MYCVASLDPANSGPRPEKSTGKQTSHPCNKCCTPEHGTLRVNHGGGLFQASVFPSFMLQCFSDLQSHGEKTSSDSNGTVGEVLNTGRHGAGLGSRGRGDGRASSGSGTGTRGGAGGSGGGRAAAGDLGTAFVGDGGGAVLLTTSAASVLTDAVGKGLLADVVGQRVLVLVHVGFRAITASAAVVKSGRFATVLTGAANLTTDVLLGSTPSSSGGESDGVNVDRESRVASRDNSQNRQGGNGNLGGEHVDE